VTTSLFRKTLSKVPWWAWVLLPLALVALLYFALRGGGQALWSRLGSPSAVSVDPASPLAPSITPKKAKEMKEEVKEEATDEREKIKEEAANMRDRLDG